MRHPPYHLRPNKAVDRLTFIESIRRLSKLADLEEYTYYGLGGPYLEDLRLIYEFFPEIKLVSIEEDKHTVDRQRFHKPCCNLKLMKSKVRSFLVSYEPNDNKGIFWLDYTRLKYSDFEDFITLLSILPEKSMVKLTLRCQPSDYIDKPPEKEGSKAEQFKQEYGELLPDSTLDPPHDTLKYAKVLQDMVQVASVKALPSVSELMYQPVSSFFYSDGTGMFTITGIVCRRDAEAETKRAYESLHFANLDWEDPKQIDLPVLSTKERLHLQKHLPSGEKAGAILWDALGYNVEKGKKRSEYVLQQYAEYHRYYPYFMKAMP